MLSSLTGHRGRSRARRRDPLSIRHRFEPLEPRLMLSTLPLGAHEQDTGEYMLGTVLVSVVLMESDGSKDANLENWNPLVRDGQGQVVLDGEGRTINAGSGPNLIEEAKDKIREGMAWWEDTLANFGPWLEEPTPTPVHSLDFIFDFEYAHNPVATGYEPISRPSYDYTLWVEDFLKEVGYDTFNTLEVDIRAFNNAQRLAHDADWAFTIFVVNDFNDPDGRFNYLQGGFQYAFALAGGQFFVAPAGRPSRSFAHETGHMFWARDEYEGGGSFTDQRGYYDTQNLNAWNNPTPGFVQQDSMMDSGTQQDSAWAAHISSESSLAMIGWQDSDGDGVFDVLDVPLSLTGSGSWDAETGLYHFTGQSAAQTLPNLNPSGLRNDITLNEVSLVEYSTDDGNTWTVAQEYHTYQADLSLAIDLTAGQDILIRTRCVDPGTGLTVVTSETVFHGTTQLPTSADQSGIQGFAWEDADADGTWDTGEPGLAGWTLQLVDGQGQPLNLQKILEPDDYNQWLMLNTVLSGVTVSAIGGGIGSDSVTSVLASQASTGQRVFGYARYGSTSNWATEWSGASQLLRIDFATPVSQISLDAVAPNRSAYGRLEIYDATDKLLARYTTQELTGSEFETMMLGRATPDIAYAIASGTMGSSVRLDNLRIGPETTAVTDAQGAYVLPHLPPGSYDVMAVPPSGWTVTSPATAVQHVLVGPDGLLDWDGGSPRPSDFGGYFDANSVPWRNPQNHLDVDNSGSVTPRDALLVINELSRVGAHALPSPAGSNAPPPYYDVNGDNRVSPIDALLVINYLSSRPSGASGAGDGTVPSGEGGSSSEGEFAPTMPHRFPALPETQLPQLGSPVQAGQPAVDAPPAEPAAVAPTTPPAATWEAIVATGSRRASRSRAEWEFLPTAGWLDLPGDDTLDLIAVDAARHTGNTSPSAVDRSRK